MKRKDYIKTLKAIGFETKLSKVTDLVYASCSLTPKPYKDEAGYKIIPYKLVICNMGGTDKGENQGCISCHVSATVKRPYSREWDTSGEVHKHCFIDDGKIDVHKAIKDWTSEYQLCKKGWEILK
jgi:hypothetical protein